MKTIYSKLIDFSDNDFSNINPKLFSSEGFFWVVNATTTGFAMEEIFNFTQEEDLPFKESIHLATEKLKISIANGEVSPQDQETGKEITLKNIKMIRDFVNSNCLIFNHNSVTVLGKTIATYWLTNKLIEQEFQNILSEEESGSVYRFLDTVISDHEDLEIIENKLKNNLELTLDEKVYLRGSWQRGLYFWSRLYQEIFFLSEKIISFQK